jgi:cytoskeletal protein CcmA (bactofilin family)
MMRVAARALSVFCPHCNKRASLEDFRVSGPHPGKTLTTCGNIRIEPAARVHVAIQASRVTILGTICGPVVALESVEVGQSGRVIGNIRAPRIVVREGGLIEGRCEMTRSPAPIVAAACTAEGVVEAVASVPAIPTAPPAAAPGPRPRPLPPPRACEVSTGEHSF